MYNEKTAPKVILISPIANENIKGIDAAKLNNTNIYKYSQIMRTVAAEHNIGFVDVFTQTAEKMVPEKSDLTINGIHLNSEGYSLFANILYKGLFQKNLLY